MYVSSYCPNGVFRLGRFQVKWNHFDPAAQSAILRSLIKIIPTMNEKELMQTVFGLAQMGLSKASVTSSEGSSIDARMNLFLDVLLQQLDKVYRDSRDMQLQSVSKVIYSLGQMGVQLSDKHGGTVLVRALMCLTDCPALSDIDLAQLFSGLRSMRVQWSDLDAAMRAAINRHLVTPGDVSTNISGMLSTSLDVLNGLAGLGATWDEVNLTRLVSNVNRLKDQFDARSLLSVWIVLSTMNARWSNVALVLPNLVSLIPQHVSAWKANEVAEVMEALMLVSFDYTAQFEANPSLVSPVDVTIRNALIDLTNPWYLQEV